MSNGISNHNADSRRFQTAGAKIRSEMTTDTGIAHSDSSCSSKLKSRYQLPPHIRMRIVRAIERGARFDAIEAKDEYVLTATTDKQKRVIFATEVFAEMHHAIMCLLQIRHEGPAQERKRQHKRREDMSFYRRQGKAKGDSLKATRVDRLRRKFYGEAA